MEPSKRISELLEKYWRADTDEAEETELQQYFASNPQFSDHPAAAMFGYIREEQEVESPANFGPAAREMHPVMATRWWYPMAAAAAAVLIVLSIVFLFRPGGPRARPQFSQVDTYTDARQAYSETKKAMLLVSKKLNTGENYMAEIGRINRAEQIVNNKTK